MGRDELLRLFDAGDYYGLALGANGLLLEKCHSEAEYAVLAVHLRDGVPDLMLPVISAAASSPPPRPSAPRS
jgi:hypothetical protein